MSTQFRNRLSAFATAPIASGLRVSPAARSPAAKTKVSVKGTFPTRSQ